MAEPELYGARAESSCRGKLITDEEHPQWAATLKRNKFSVQSPNIWEMLKLPLIIQKLGARGTE